MKLLTGKKRNAATALFQFRTVKDVVAHVTLPLRDGPLRLQAGLLTPEEQNELIDLTREGWDDGFKLSALDRRGRERWERLVEQAAGRRHGSFFAADREADE